jgi:hypothetical protein
MTEEDATRVQDDGEGEAECITSLSAALVQIDPFAYPGPFHPDTAYRLLIGFKAHNKVLATLLLLPPLRLAIARNQLRGLLAMKAMETISKIKREETVGQIAAVQSKHTPVASRIISIYQKLYEEADRKRSFLRQSQAISESARMTSSEVATKVYETLCHSARILGERSRGRKPGNQASLHSSLSSISKEESGNHLYSAQLTSALPTTSSAPVLKPSLPVHHKLFSQSSQQDTKLRKEQLERKSKEREDAPFVPRVNAGKRGKGQGPAYLRLYEMGEALRKKMEVKREERKGARRKSSNTSEDSHYEHLYVSAKDRSQRQAELRAKVNYEEGVSFIPQTNHYPTALLSKVYGRR